MSKLKLHKLIKEDSVSPSYRRMLNALNNVIPMVFPDSIMLFFTNNLPTILLRLDWFPVLNFSKSIP